jgi:hypothetical protein
MSAVVRIGFDGKAVTSGLAGLESRMRGFAKGVVGLGNIGGSLGTIGGALGMGLMVRRGFEFNQTVKDSEIAIANVLAQFQGLNDEAARGEAANAMAQIIKLEPEAAGSLTTLIDGFLATLGASQAAGISVEQNIDLVGRFANALANANIPAEQLAQEMRSIISGNIGADSTLAKVLSIGNDDVKKAQQAGKLYDFLLDRIGKMGTAGDTAGVAFSTLGSAIDKALGAVTQGLFGEAVTGAKEFSVVIEDMLPILEDVGAAWASMAKGGKALFEDLTDSAAMLMMALDGSAGGTFFSRLEEAAREIAAQDDQAEQRRKKAKQEADAAAKQPGAGGSGTPMTTTGGATSTTTAQLDEVERARQRYAEAQFAALQRRATLEDQIANIVKREADIRKQMDAGPLQESVRLGLLTELLGFEEERLQLQKEISDKVAEENKAVQDKAASQKEALDLLAQETEILAAKAAGQDALVAKLEREQSIRERAAQIAAQTGVSEEKSLKIAEQMQDLIEKGEKNERPDSERGRRRIQGFSWAREGGREEAEARADQRRAESASKRAAAYERSFGGLAEFERLNARGPGGTGRNIPLGRAFVGAETRSDPSVPLLDEIKNLMAQNNEYLSTLSAE